jgi:hypothetical protein
MEVGGRGVTWRQPPLRQWGQQWRSGVAVVTSSLAEPRRRVSVLHHVSRGGAAGMGRQPHVTTCGGGWCSAPVRG